MESCMFLMQNPMQPLVWTKWITSLLNECLGGGERMGGGRGGESKKTFIPSNERDILQFLYLHNYSTMSIYANKGESSYRCMKSHTAILESLKDTDERWCYT